MMNTTVRKKILLVEDEVIIAATEAAHSGERAVRVAIDDENVSLILMDINLGKGIDGVEAAQQILEERKLPIVFLTSHAEEEIVGKVRGITRYGYVIKDSGDFVLNSSIQMAFELYQAQTHASNKNRDLDKAQSLAHIGSWTIDMETDLLIWSEELYRIFGLEKRSFSGSLRTAGTEAVHPADRDIVERANALMVSDKKPFAYEYRVILNDHSVHTLLAEGGALIVDKAGNLRVANGTVQDITDRRRKEVALQEKNEEYESTNEELRSSTEELQAATEELRIQNAELQEKDAALRNVAHYSRSLIEAALDPLVTISSEGKITDVNWATEQITGVDRGQLIGTDFADYFTEPELARAGYQKVFEQGHVIDYPLAIRNASGRLTDVLYNASVYRDKSGKVLGVFAAARDISERKKAEYLLRSHEFTFRTVADFTYDWEYWTSSKGQILYMSPSCERMTGYSREELTANPVLLEAMVDPNDLVKFSHHQICLSQEKHWNDICEFEYEAMTKGGSTVSIGHLCRPVFDDTHHYLGRRVSNRDMTENKKARQVIEASEIKYRRLFEAAQDGILMLDAATGIITDVNPFLTTLLGFPKEFFCGKRLWEIGVFKDIASNTVKFAELQEQEYIRYEDMPLKTADGREIDVEFISNVYNAGGKHVI
jgi:PAS domain S-box-containing protein